MDYDVDKELEKLKISIMEQEILKYGNFISVQDIKEEKETK